MARKYVRERPRWMQKSLDASVFRAQAFPCPHVARKRRILACVLRITRVFTHVCRAQGKYSRINIANPDNIYGFVSHFARSATIGAVMVAYRAHSIHSCIHV